MSSPFDEVRMGGNNNINNASKMENSDDGAVDGFGRPANYDGGSDHFMLQRFVSSTPQRMMLPQTPNEASPGMGSSGLLSMLDPVSPGSDLAAGGTIPRSQMTEIPKFSSFNQVMLSLAKMESGFSELRDIFDSFAEGSANNTVSIEDLERIFLKSGINVSDSILQDVMSQSNQKGGTDDDSNKNKCGTTIDDGNNDDATKQPARVGSPESGGESKLAADSSFWKREEDQIR